MMNRLRLSQLIRVTNLRFSFALFTCALFVCGCGTAPPKPYPKAMVGIERVAVISLLGEEIESQHDDINAKHSYYRTGDLGLNLNQNTVELAYDVLDDSGFELVRVEYDYAVMYEKHRQKQKLTDDLINLSDKYGLDAVMLLTPGGLGGKCYKHTQWGSLYCVGPGDYGYGIYLRTQPDDSTWRMDTVHRSEAYVSVKISFISKRNEFRPIAVSLAAAQVPLTISEWRSSFSEHSRSEIESIQDGLREAAADAIRNTVGTMQLRKSDAS